jgi:hypothetical protein
MTACCVTQRSSWRIEREDDGPTGEAAIGSERGRLAGGKRPVIFPSASHTGERCASQRIKAVAERAPHLQNRGDIGALRPLRARKQPDVRDCVIELRVF